MYNHPWIGLVNIFVYNDSYLQLIQRDENRCKKKTNPGNVLQVYIIHCLKPALIYLPVSVKKWYCPIFMHL